MGPALGQDVDDLGTATPSPLGSCSSSPGAAGAYEATRAGGLLPLHRLGKLGVCWYGCELEFGVFGISCMFLRTEVGQVDLLCHCLNGQSVRFPGFFPLRYFQKSDSFGSSMFLSALCISCRLFAIFFIVFHFPTPY